MRIYPLGIITFLLRYFFLGKCIEQSHAAIEAVEQLCKHSEKQDAEACIAACDDTPKKRLQKTQVEM